MRHREGVAGIVWRQPLLHASEGVCTCNHSSGDGGSDKGLSNMMWAGSGAMSLPLCAYIPACQPASSAYPRDDVGEGLGAVPTRCDTAGMRCWLHSQRPVRVSQRCRSNTCLDFTPEPPQGLQSMSPTIALPLLLWGFGISLWEWKWWRSLGASQWGTKQTEHLRSAASIFHWSLMSVQLHVVTRYESDRLHPPYRPG